MLYDKWERIFRSHLSFIGEHNAAIFVLPKLKKSYRAESARLAKPKKAEFTRVNEHFEGEHNTAIFVLPKLKKNRIGRRVQGSRREKNRSLLDVNEDFSHKHNAASFVLPKPKKSYRAESARLAKPKKAEFTRVNEHFEGEHNAAIFVLYGFYLREFIRILAFTNAIARIRLISISLSAW